MICARGPRGWFAPGGPRGWFVPGGPRGWFVPGGPRGWFVPGAQGMVRTLSIFKTSLNSSWVRGRERGYYEGT